MRGILTSKCNHQRRFFDMYDDNHKNAGFLFVDVRLRSQRCNRRDRDLGAYTSRDQSHVLCSTRASQMTSLNAQLLLALAQRSVKHSF